MVGKRTAASVYVCVAAAWRAGGGGRLSFKDPACSPIFHTTVTS